MQYIKDFFTLPLEEQQAALSHVATQKELPLIVVEKIYRIIYEKRT